MIVFEAEVKSPEENKVGKAAARVDGTTAKLKANPMSNNCYFCLQASKMQP